MKNVKMAGILSLKTCFDTRSFQNINMDDTLYNWDMICSDIESGIISNLTLSGPNIDDQHIFKISSLDIPLSKQFSILIINTNITNVGLGALFNFIMRKDRCITLTFLDNIKINKSFSKYLSDLSRILIDNKSFRDDPFVLECFKKYKTNS